MLTVVAVATVGAKAADSSSAAVKSTIFWRSRGALGVLCMVMVLECGRAQTRRGKDVGMVDVDAAERYAQGRATQYAAPTLARVRSCPLRLPRE